MKIDTDSLKKCLSQTVIGRKQSLPILGCVKIEAKNNRFKISSTDLDAWSVAETDCDGDLEAVCVSADKFRQQAGYANSSITMSLEKNNRLNFNSGFKVQIAGLAGDEYPPLPDGKAKVVGVNCGDLADCIESVYWAAHPDNNDTLHIVDIKLTGKAILATGTDRKMLAFNLHPAVTPETAFAFPPENAKALAVALRCDKATLSLTDKHIIAKHDSGCFMVRLCDHKYADFSKYIQAEKWTRLGEIESVQELADVTGQCFQLNTTKDNFVPVSLTFSADGLEVESSELVNHLKRKIKGKFKPWTCRTNSQLLNTILTNAKCEKMVASYSQGQGILIFESGDLMVGVQTLTGKVAA